MTIEEGHLITEGIVPDARIGIDRAAGPTAQVNQEIVVTVRLPPRDRVFLFRFPAVPGVKAPVDAPVETFLGSEGLGGGRTLPKLHISPVHSKT